MFTDIAGSTELASKLGDRKWRELLDAHNALIRNELKRFGGREMDTAGDGFFATFNQPAPAIRCSRAITRDVRHLGIEVRAGIHMGEVEVIGQKVAGIAVHIGARIASKAQAGEVLVSSTVKDLMAGSDTVFEDRGNHELKGVEGVWRLFAVNPDVTFESIRADSLDRTPPTVTAPPTGDRRRLIRRPIVIAGSLVVGTMAILGVVALTHRGPDGQTVHTTSSPAPEMSAPDNQLLRLVPAEIADSCQPAEPGFVGADASLTCTSKTGLKDMRGEPDVYNIEYSHFASRDDMDAAFEQGLHAVPLVAPGNCATAHSARDAYTIGSKPAGEVACFQTDQRSYIDWTDDRVLVYAVAYRNDLGDLPVYQWWASSAGPVAAGTALVPKDAGPLNTPGSPNHFLGFPTGTFVKTIKGDLDVGRWKLVLSGEETQGRYKEFVQPLFFERGYWALGKRDEFIIWTPFGVCAGVGFGVYRFHLDEPTPGHILASFDFVSDACGYTGPPDGTSWSHGPPWRLIR